MNNEKKVSLAIDGCKNAFELAKAANLSLSCRIRPEGD
jgi:hypothetical protein